MTDKDKIAALEAELILRKRTILFLITEYASRYENERPKIITFLKEVRPDLAPNTGEVVREILDAVTKS